MSELTSVTDRTEPTDAAGSVEEVAAGLHFPTSLAFADDGTAYVAESGLPFAGAPPGGRVWRLNTDGTRDLLADGLAAPVNGLVRAGDVLYVSEGGQPSGISRLHPDGRLETVLTGFPGPGNYHLDTVAVGPDGKLYFGHGAMTNLGVVGLDAYEVGWLRRLPHGHDVPGYDVVLRGVDATTPDPTSDDADAKAVTGGFVPFGTPTEPGQRIAAGLPATAAVMRCEPDGSGLELVAWGLRNPYGLGFLPDGRLLAVDQGADDRGSRGVGEAPDLLVEVRVGAWYGWPDFIGDVPVTDDRFRTERAPRAEFLLANHDELPPPERPLLEFPAHTAATKFDVAPPGSAYAGSLFVTLFGDEVPMTAPRGPRVGRSVVLVDTRTWQLTPFVAGPWRRPIDVRVHPDGQSLWVLDFGQFEMTDRGIEAEAGTGRVWRVPLTHDDSATTAER